MISKNSNRFKLHKGEYKLLRKHSSFGGIFVQLLIFSHAQLSFQPVETVRGRKGLFELRVAGVHGAVDTAERIGEEGAALDEYVTASSDDETVFTI